MQMEYVRRGIHRRREARSRADLISEKMHFYVHALFPISRKHEITRRTSSKCFFHSRGTCGANGPPPPPPISLLSL